MGIEEHRAEPAPALQRGSGKARAAKAATTRFHAQSPGGTTKQDLAAALCTTLRIANAPLG